LAKEEQQILLQLGYEHLLNPKHEIPAFAEAASRRQAKFETNPNYLNTKFKPDDSTVF